MTADPGARLRPGQIAVLVLLGLLVRVGYEATVWTDTGAVGTLGTHLLGDERAYDQFARDSAAGTLDRERAFYQEPMYAWLVGRLYSVWTPSPVPPDATAIPVDGVRLAVLIAQHVLGLALIVATACLGARALGARAGWIAGALVAVSAPTVFHEAMLLKASLSLLLIVLCLTFWLDVLEGAGRRRVVALGLCLGAGVLLRGNLYLLLALVLASLVVRREGRRPGAALVVGVLALLVVSPATVHNIRRGEWVLTTYQAGSNAAIGHPAGDDPDQGIIYAPLRAGRGDARFEEADAVALAEAGAGRRLAGHEVSSWWWARVFERIQENPGVAAQRTLVKAAHLFHGREVPDVKDLAFFTDQIPWLGTPVSNLVILGPWALLGFVFLPWRRRPGLLVVRGGVLVVGVSLALFYVMGRYRLSALPLLCILAAGAMVAGWSVLTGGGPLWRKLLVAAAAVLVPLGYSALPLPSDVRGHHTSWANASTVERQYAETATDPEQARTRRERALDDARQAVAIAPLFPSGRAALVRALGLRTAVLEPDVDEARLEGWRLLLLMEGIRTGTDVLDRLEAPEPLVARSALELQRLPSRPGQDDFTAPMRAWAARSIVPYLKPGQVPYPADDEVYPLALRLSELSLQLEPEEALAHVQRGLSLKRLGRLPEAEAAYRASIAGGLDGVEVYNNLGNLLLTMDRPGEAVECLERAVSMAPDNDFLRQNLARARGALDASLRDERP